MFCAKKVTKLPDLTVRSSKPGRKRRAQKVLNDMQKTRHSSGRTIRLIDHPLPPPSPCNLSLFLGLPLSRWSSLLTGEQWGRGWARSQVIRPRGSLAPINHSILSGRARTKQVLIRNIIHQAGTEYSGERDHRKCLASKKETTLLFSGLVHASQLTEWLMCLNLLYNLMHGGSPLHSQNQCCGSGSGSNGSTCFWASRIRIHQSELWIRIRILLSSSKISKKTLIPTIL